MRPNINIVFSQPPEGVPEDDFNTWYDAHLDEILSIPGFVSAQRFRLEPAVVDPDVPAPYRYIALFELAGDPGPIMAEMARMGLASKESYVELKEQDPSGPPLPDWWDEVRFASWNCTAIGDRVEASS